MTEERRELPDEIREELDRAAAPLDDHEEQERNSGVAIAVLAALVVLLLLAIVLGTTDAFRP